jgi:low temperature requirement protein LtrA
MNFTWFASAYDNDDVPYRIAVFVQMTGVLILAAGVPRAFEDVNFGVMTLGYVVMRLAMVALWIRAGLQHVEGRPSAFRYAIGIAVVQVGWVARLWLPDDAGLVAFFVLAAIELAIPIWAEQAGRTPWHPTSPALWAVHDHRAFGESVLGHVSVQAAIDSTLGDLVVIVGGLLTLRHVVDLLDRRTESRAKRVRQTSQRTYAFT